MTTQLGLDFTTINFYDGQGFLVPEDSGITSTLELDGATVCVLTGTTTELNLADYFRANNMEFTPVTKRETSTSSSKPISVAAATPTPTTSRASPPAVRLSRTRTSTSSCPRRSPRNRSARSVRNDDSAWGDIVRWTLFGMIEAEELGVSSENVEEMLESDSPRDPASARRRGQYR